MILAFDYGMFKKCDLEGLKEKEVAQLSRNEAGVEKQ